MSYLSPAEDMPHGVSRLIYPLARLPIAPKEVSHGASWSMHLFVRSDCPRACVVTSCVGHPRLNLRILVQIGTSWFDLFACIS